ncbi:UBX domain-containing protein 5 [Apiospora saccharicola]
MDEDVAQFQAITGTDSEQVARGYLEISGNDPMQAIQLFFENPELASSFTTQANNPSSSHPPSAAQPRAPSGRQDDHGVIHIDSDDDDDVEMSQPSDHRNHITIPDNTGHDHENIAALARQAQEDEDAAMARHLQDDMYSQDPGAADGVRAPMARTTETLVAPDPSWSLDDDDRDAAVLEQLRRRQQSRNNRPARNPFSQSVWDEPGATSAGVPPVPMGSRPSGPAPSTSRSQRLADLFRPPYDIISRCSWDEAREMGKEEKKWIMVNVQDMSDFNCQSLNRDHWKDENISSLLKEHFIFLQYEKGSAESQTYVSFYFNAGHEDPNSYPYVSIIDPRTGEQVKTWSGLPFPPAGEFYNDLVEFLDRYSLAANSKNPVSVSKPKSKPVDVGRMTEEEMLQMAMQNSLDSSGSSSRAGVQDPDQLTKSQLADEKGEDMETEQTSSTTVAAPSESAFQRISSATPHTEPAPDPATVTRIQFRHPAGRVIRRFAIADPVRRIYEWLKAEPLEGKEGVPFELKAQPGGDLVEKLDLTIEEAGLKQGTVMIELIEDDS